MEYRITLTKTKVTSACRDFESAMQYMESLTRDHIAFSFEFN